MTSDRKQGFKAGILLIGLLLSLPGLLFAQFSRYAQIGGQQAGEELGEAFYALDANLTDNNTRDFLIGAPGADVGGHSEAGRIYWFETPIDQDTVLTDEMVIAEGHDYSTRVGEEFVYGDFNNNGEVDLAIALSDGYNSFNDESYVAVFFGPFTPGEPVSTADPDVWITGPNENDSFGDRLAVLPHQDQEDGLLIAAPDADDPDSETGSVYLFETLAEREEWSYQDVTVHFRNTEAHSFFGNDLDGGRDFTGNGYADVIISAHHSRKHEFRSGAIYLFEGPFTQNEYEVEEADVSIYGPEENTFWGARVIGQGDVTGNGLTDFGLATTLNRSGRVAFFEGRENWPEEIILDTEEAMEAGESRHRIYASSGRNENTGTWFDFSGDYNLDGNLNPLVGAATTDDSQGAISVYRFGGSVMRNIRPNVASDSYFGRRVTNAGNQTDPGADIVVDDFAVSAPGASYSIGGESLSSGVIFLYAGELMPPETNFSVDPGTNLFPGDEVELTMSFEEGSRPVVEERLVVIEYEHVPDDSDNEIQRDTIRFDREEGRQLQETFSYSEDRRILFRYEAVDELGQISREGTNVHFTEAPDEFFLSRYEPGDSPIVIEGSPIQEISYQFQASSHDHRDIDYRLAYALHPEGFDEGEYEILKGSADTEIVLTYDEINQYMRETGQFPEGDEVAVYWNVLVTNNIHSRWASDGPNGHTMVRIGLDPFFQLPNEEKELVVQGFSGESFSFGWEPMITDNPNHILQYYFRLLESDDPEAYLWEQPTGDQARDTDLSFTYEELRDSLEAHNLLEEAREDTLDLYYTVRSLIVNDDHNVFPEPATVPLKIYFEDVSSTEDEPALPDEFAVRENYPNPFNNQTTIRYELPDRNQVTIEIFDVTGRSVYTRHSSSPVAAGVHEHAVDATGWSSGTYIYTVTAAGKRASGTMTLIK